jgi:HEAT repeat protein
MPAGETESRPFGEVPSIPDLDAPQGHHDEPPAAPPQDRVPGRMGLPAEGDSPAFVRLRAERLLQRREAPPSEAWAALGGGVGDLLLQLLDDPSIVAYEALRQRVIATLGQLGIVQAIPRLGEILRDRSESALTRTFAASALGRLRDRRAVVVLGRAVAERDEMVRRQVALALGRVGTPEAVPYLLTLRADQTAHIAEAAAAGLRAYEQQLGRAIDPTGGTAGSP